MISPKPEGYVERPPRDNNRSRVNRNRDNRCDDRKPRQDKKKINFF